MIMNVVTFRWAADVTKLDVDALMEELAALPEQIPALSSYRFGSDAGLRPESGDFAIVATLPDRASLAAYIEDPMHMQVAARLRRMASSRTAVQVELPD